MIVGVLNIELFIPGSNSLKTKRSIIKGIKDRLRSHFNVSVAEIDHADKWQRASLGVSSVSNKKNMSRVSWAKYWLLYITITVLKS